MQQMDAEMQRSLLSTLDELASLSRATILSMLKSALRIEQKADKSLVTNVDLETEKLLRAEIAKRFPEHGIIGEEFPPRNPDSAWIWYLDPIDGTAEFASGLATYGSIIGLYHEGQNIAGVIDHPQLDVRVSAVRGAGCWKNGTRISLANTAASPTMRLALASPSNFARHRDAQQLFHQLCWSFPNVRIFSSCYAHAMTACGGFDAAIEFNVRRWDLAATKVLTEEAGGCYRELPSFDNPAGQPVCSAIYGKLQPVEALYELVASNLQVENSR